VLFLSCVCRCRACCSVGVCVCVCDLLIVFTRGARPPPSHDIHPCPPPTGIPVSPTGIVQAATVASELRLSAWPLHDIVITNIVWCMAYKITFGGGVYCLRVVQ